MDGSFAEGYPNSFYCPITTALMRDPVVDREGHSYEKEAIESWLRRKKTSPVTRSPLRPEDLTPNRGLKEAIDMAVQSGAAKTMAASGPPQVDLVSGGLAVGGLLVSGLKLAKQKTVEAAVFVEKERAESSCRRLEREHAAQFAAERRGGALPPPPEPEASVGGAVGGAAADALYVAGSAGSSLVGRLSAAGDAAMAGAMPAARHPPATHVNLPSGDEREYDDDDWGRRRSQHGPPLPATTMTPGMEEIDLDGGTADGGTNGKQNCCCCCAAAFGMMSIARNVSEFRLLVLLAPAERAGRECIASSRCDFGCTTIAEVSFQWKNPDFLFRNPDLVSGILIFHFTMLIL